MQDNRFEKLKEICNELVQMTKEDGLYEAKTSAVFFSADGYIHIMYGNEDYMLSPDVMPGWMKMEGNTYVPAE